MIPSSIPSFFRQMPSASVASIRQPGQEDLPGGGVGEAEAPQEVRLKPPPLYRVVLLNDDYTPMEFVVDVLRKFFGMDMETATRVMLKVHTEGKGVCGVYPKDVAETKALQVNDYARESQHPLLSDVEEDD